MFIKLSPCLIFFSLFGACSTTYENTQTPDSSPPFSSTQQSSPSNSSSSLPAKPPVPPPPPMDLEPIRLPQVSLTLNTVDSFIRWAAASPRAQADEVQANIHQARCEPTPQPLCNLAIIDALLQRVDKQDLELSTRLMVLSILGELRDSHAVPKLANFVWRPLSSGPAFIDHDQLTSKGAQEMLQARAVEALAYQRSTSALQLTLDVAKRHPSDMVRAAAIDAYLYNQDDSVTARKTLESTLSQEDLPFLFRARKTESTKADEFNKALAEFNRRFPPNIPPISKTQDPQPTSSKPETPVGHPPVIKCPTGTTCR